MSVTADNPSITELVPPLAVFRRDLHRHPEPGFAETRTARRIAEELRRAGIEVTEGIAGTGLVATIHGHERGGRSLGIRADMDALAITESTGAAYASQNPGMMHACGHDGHVAILVGAAQYLAAHPDFGGTVHLIFQPGEETGTGAKQMIAENIFDRFPCEAVYALRVTPTAPAGAISTAAGPLMAGAGSFTVTFTGRGGHGGMAPHLAQDLTIVQSHFTLALQSIVGREVPPDERAVISVGYLQAGNLDAFNAMPDRLVVTLRCFSMGVQELLSARIWELAVSLAAFYGANAQVDIEWLTPPVINSPEQADIVLRAATATVGKDRVDGRQQPSMAGEDFAYLLQERPGALMFLGNGDGGTRGVTVPALHTPRFDFNDDVIGTGIAYWANLVRQQLGSGQRHQAGAD